ncbi:inorganic phosphate transporter [Metabacillus litoralis]|uniref:inorganic phosphate transporter n=1 Tax=Metabacillus litoralis TaxID=152268 RepID=UPI00203B78B5|nr:inorganic phosphate transporter [Metabacillus litoralis]MCM3410208.1 inorganic phosphate transporter [Metabacillus litoralis]
MQLFSTFEHTVNIEMAVATLEKKGIRRESIFVVPLDNRTEDHKVFDNIHRSDGTSLIDVGAALATAFSVIGASIGFKLAWGPIYWGLIGAFVGFILGFAIRLFTEKVIKKRRRLLKGFHSELIVIVDCDESQGELVENILFSHYALGVAKVK